LPTWRPRASTSASGAQTPPTNSSTPPCPPSSAKGCAALESFGARCRPGDSADDPDDLALIGDVYDLLGEDLDGAAAELEDLGLV
jgi:hypothetical protein